MNSKKIGDWLFKRINYYPREGIGQIDRFSDVSYRVYLYPKSNNIFEPSAVAYGI